MKARRHSVADQTEPNAVQFGPSAGKSSDARFRSPTTKAPKPRKASAGEKSIHLWAASRPGHRQSHSLRQQSHPARFVAGAGILWRASTHKRGCSAGGHRHRIPCKRSPGASQFCTPRRQETARVSAEAPRSGNRGERDPGRNDLLAQQAVMGLQDAHTVAEGNARWGVPRGGGLPRRRQQPAWQGNVGVSSPSETDAAGLALRACLSRFRPAPCPCSPGSGCTTRTPFLPVRWRIGARALRAARRGRQLEGSVAPRYCCTSWATQADCLAMKVSSVIWPASIMSSACSPHRRRARIGDGRRHRVDQRESRIRCADGTALLHKIAACQ